LWRHSFRSLKLGIRTLLRSPGLPLSPFTLALGIDANTAIFSVVQGVMLAQLPYKQPDQLVIAWEMNPQGLHSSSPRDYGGAHRGIETRIVLGDICAISVPKNKSHKRLVAICFLGR
jgi:hypothetical protein